MSDQALTTTESKSNQALDWLQIRWGESKLMAKTIVALTFIVNGVALALFAFDFVKPTPTAAAIMGAISASFAAIVLFSTVHNGVKSQSTNKRKR